MRVKRVGNHDLPIPVRHSPDAAGYDLQAAEDVVVRPHSVCVVKTGFAWEIDPETGGSVLPVKNYALIRDRSGFAIRNSCFVVAGVIDADYRGEVLVALHNASSQDVRITKGDRIAQMIVGVCYTYDLGEVEQDVELTKTDRGEGGFGSTGS